MMPQAEQGKTAEDGDRNGYITYIKIYSTHASLNPVAQSLALALLTEPNIT